jgi:glycerophosphoryl diester phosphodiesterase
VIDLVDPDARPLIAHRGASGEFPENTLLAFERGLDQGADALEFDVRLSSDGVPVVIHDATVDRTTDASGPVSGFSAAGLALLDAGSGERVPTVAEVLDRFPETPCIIEVKETAAAGPLADLMRLHHATGRVVVGAFEHTALTSFRVPEFRRAASRREVAVFWLGSRVGLGVSMGGFAAFTVPVRWGSLTVVDSRFVRAAQRQQRPVHVWTVNDKHEAGRLRELGVAGIITDFPARMRGLCA